MQNCCDENDSDGDNDVIYKDVVIIGIYFNIY